MSDYAAGEERNWVLATYGLFLIGPASSGLTALVGVILAHLRRDAARGSLYESHYRNLILVFWVWLIFVLFAMAFVFTSLAGLVLSWIQTWPAGGFGLYLNSLTLGLLFLAFIIVGFWYYWRLLRGLIRALDDKPY